VCRLWQTIKQAERYADILEDTFDRLLFMPELARERPEFDPPFCIYTSAEYLIVYRSLRNLVKNLGMV